MEFKDKGLFHNSTTSAKFQEAYKQLTNKYIPAQAKIDSLPLSFYTGIAIDGTHFAFVFFEENGKSRHTALLQIDENSTPLLLDAMLSNRRRAFSLENLLEDFGSDSARARQVLAELWHHLERSLDEHNGSPKVRMLYQEWSRIFAQVTNLGRVGKSRIDNYLLSLGLDRPLDYTRALFTLHTYNALLIKLIAGELITTLRFERYSGFASQAAGSPLHMLKDFLIRRIEQAEIFVNNGIENFIEGTFFSWYIERCPDSLLLALREVLSRLGMYIFPTTTQNQVRDIIKAFYQSLVPEALRKNIGEFYTPEWLVLQREWIPPGLPNALHEFRSHVLVNSVWLPTEVLQNALSL